jgi:hypothetical protein
VVVVGIIRNGKNGSSKKQIDCLLSSSSSSSSNSDVFHQDYGEDSIYYPSHPYILFFS